MSKKIAIIAGVGQGLGAALCRTFSEAGYHVAALARSTRITQQLADTASTRGEFITPIECDLTDHDSIRKAYDKILNLDGDISVYVHNASTFHMGDFLNFSEDKFEEAWRLTCFSAFSLSKLVIPEMLKHNGGAILFTGATASVKANSKFAAFASAKFALRGLSQSLAREFGPQGIHVAHIILDGIIYCDWTQASFGSDKDRTMMPEAIAKNYLQLAQQHSSSWTQELDLRPYNEGY